jgi:hypothetical protein
MLSLTTAFLLNNIWTLLLLVAFIFNIKQRQDNKPVIYTSLILVLGFTLPSITYTQYVVKMATIHVYKASLNLHIG